MNRTAHAHKTSGCQIDLEEIGRVVQLHEKILAVGLWDEKSVDDIIDALLSGSDDIGEWEACFEVGPVLTVASCRGVK